MKAFMVSTILFLNICLLVQASTVYAEGDLVKLVTVEGAAHHEYNVPNSVAWPQIKAAVLSLTGNQ